MTCVCGEIDVDPGGCQVIGLFLHRTDGPCYLIDYKEPQLGCATTEQLMQELIARFEVGHTIHAALSYDDALKADDEELGSSVNYLRAQTLWNILFGMDSTTREYRTVGDV